MSSSSDEPVVQAAIDTLDRLKVDYEVRVMSAYRNPERVREYALSARERGIEVFISAAGGSAALGGVLAAWSTIPVIGIPLASSDLNGIDALMATAQMPPGVPVACMAVGSWGARNAALFAAQVLGIKHDDIRESFENYRKELQAS
ncbi:MAG: 5-(carboxyamino)imidazole ribonucleotide mutase [Chloroflexota bacterium]|nr:5-(carboxyamino)imidazole ribonucleotide mutase [Chloroflexota bacterium]